MEISVFGLGYVGSVTAACLAECGHRVIGTDIYAPKVAALQAGQVPVREPELEALVMRNLTAGRLTFTMDSREAIAQSSCSLIAVGTPSGAQGEVELEAVERCVESIALALGSLHEKPRHGLVLRSTVPPGVTRRMLTLAEKLSGRQLGQSLLGGFNPEFLREGQAVADFMDPSLVVVGAFDADSETMIQALYTTIPGERVAVTMEAAELIKYVNNAYHALKISFANEVGEVASAYGIDGQEVMDVLCRDTKLNLSAQYLRPGFAYGGSCLPKDLRTLNHLAYKATVDTPLLAAIAPSNKAHIDRALNTILAQRPRRVGVLGITFKAGTDDVRESPALFLIHALLQAGVAVQMYDEGVIPDKLLGANRRFINRILPDWEKRLVSTPEALADGADLLVVTHDAPNHLAFLNQYGKQWGHLPVVNLCGVPALPDPVIGHGANGHVAKMYRPPTY